MEMLMFVWQVITSPLYPLSSQRHVLKSQIFMAIEGSAGERGLRPLSNFIPLLNIIKIGHEY